MSLCQCGCGKDAGVYETNNPSRKQTKGAPRRFLYGHGRGLQQKLKTHCKKGHEFTPENTRMKTDGSGRYCVQCSIEQNRKKYGLTPEEYNRKLDSQHGLCDLCGEPFYGTMREGHDPVLDHNHETQKTRGFVHRTCNTAIGHLKDDPKLCLKAAEYLLRWK